MKYSFYTALTMLALAGTMSACDSQATNKAEAGVQTTPQCLTDTLLKDMQLDTVKVTQVQEELNLNGKLSMDENREANIFPLVTGTVKEVHAEPGDYVHKGQVLAVVLSGDIAELDQRKREAEANLTIAKKNLQTAAELFESKLGSERDYIAAKEELSKAQSEAAKASELLRLYGAQGVASQIIRSPADGYVLQRTVNEGTDIRANDPQALFTISNLKQIWAMANVFETDIDKVKVGQVAEVSTISYPDRKFVGTIDKVYSVVDPTSRSMRVRVKLSNDDLMLKPEMFATVHVVYPLADKLPAIDAQAIIFDDNRNHVVVFKGKCSYEARQVELAGTSGGKAYIKSGVMPGERVISRKQLLAYESLTDQ